MSQSRTQEVAEPVAQGCTSTALVKRAWAKNRSTDLFPVQPIRRPTFLHLRSNCYLVHKASNPTVAPTANACKDSGRIHTG